MYKQLYFIQFLKFLDHSLYFILQQLLWLQIIPTQKDENKFNKILSNLCIILVNLIIDIKIHNLNFDSTNLLLFPLSTFKKQHACILRKYHYVKSIFSLYEYQN